MVTSTRADDPADATLQLWNLVDGSTRMLPNRPVFSPDGKILVTSYLGQREYPLFRAEGGVHQLWIYPPAHSSQLSPPVTT